MVIAGEMKADVFGLTDRGRKREHNEDQFLISDLSKSILVTQSSLAQADHERLVGRVQGKLLVVADGLGGHKGGQVASSVAVEAILTKHVSDETIGRRLADGGTSEAVVRDLVTAANAAGGTDNVTAIVARFH
jgi:protein phosphatase